MRDIIPIDEVKRFIVDCFVAVKTPREHAEMMADLLASADYRGHYSHGMNRLEFYLNDIKVGGLCPEAKPKIVKVGYNYRIVHFIKMSTNCSIILR